MNIVHPLCPTMNLVSTSINNHKFEHFVRELKTGAIALEKSLTSARLVCSYVYLCMCIYVLCMYMFIYEYLLAYVLPCLLRIISFVKMICNQLIHAHMNECMNIIG